MTLRLRNKPICGVALHPASLWRAQQDASLLGFARLASGVFCEAAPGGIFYRRTRHLK
jgi:hypothetical protein